MYFNLHFHVFVLGYPNVLDPKLTCRFSLGAIILTISNPVNVSGGEEEEAKANYFLMSSSYM
jgi:hypothetical protein